MLLALVMDRTCNRETYRLLYFWSLPSLTNCGYKSSYIPFTCTCIQYLGTFQTFKPDILFTVR